MVSFISKQALYFAPFIMVIYWIMWRRAKHITTLLLSIYTENYLARAGFNKIFIFKIIIITLFYFSMLFGLSKPEYVTQNKGGSEEEKTLIIMSIDISKSMYVLEGNHTRIEKIVEFFQNMINEYSSSSNILYVVYGFTNKIIQLSPPTNDVEYIRNLLSMVSSNPIIDGSTDLTSVIQNLSQIYLPRINISNNTILFFASDGETHTVTHPQSFSSLAEQDIEIVMLSVGTELGGTVPDMKGRILIENGKEVVSHANPSLINSISNTIGATYINLQSDYAPQIFKQTNVHKERNDISWIGWLMASITLLGYIITILL